MPIIISILIIPVSLVIRICQNFGPPINAPDAPIVFQEPGFRCFRQFGKRPDDVQAELFCTSSEIAFV